MTNRLYALEVTTGLDSQHCNATRVTSAAIKAFDD